MTLLRISGRILYADRETWGANTALPRLGGPEDPRRNWGLVPRDARTHAIHHHTVVIDNDDTPNRWESLSEIYRRMRQLQTIRLDLGADVPYNAVAFIMADDFGLATLVICEGRGFDRWGAHTKGIDDNGQYHNGSGLALGVQGNFELPFELAPWVPDFSTFWTWVVGGAGDDEPFVNLGTLRPVRAEVYGHRDFRVEDDRDTWTACPGQNQYDILPEIRLHAEKESDEMAYLFIKAPNDPTVYLTGGMTRRPMTGERVELAKLLNISDQVVDVSDELMDTIPKAG